MNPVTPQHFPSRFIPQGIAGGIIAGIVFIIAEMLMNVALGRPFFGPLRMIASIVLGPEALNSTYSFAALMIWGLVVHFILAGLFGLIFAIILNITGTSMKIGRCCLTDFFTAPRCGW